MSAATYISTTGTYHPDDEVVVRFALRNNTQYSTVTPSDDGSSGGNNGGSGDISNGICCGQRETDTLVTVNRLIQLSSSKTRVNFFRQLNADFIQLRIDVKLSASSTAMFHIHNVSLLASTPRRDMPFWSEWSNVMWGEWSSWMPNICGVSQFRNRTGIRTRDCIVPTCSPPSSTCEGDMEEIIFQLENRTADYNCCPVDGGWSPWSNPTPITSWFPWAPSQCGFPQTRTRVMSQTRNCTNPEQSCGGLPCEGNSDTFIVETQERSADDNCCRVDGEWTVWSSSPWSNWSAYEPSVCGVEQNKTRTRSWHRSCTNPEPACNGNPCDGETYFVEVDTYTRDANSNCCPIDGGWSNWTIFPWSVWSSYSPKECGVDQIRERVRISNRTCSNPVPECGGATCFGNDTIVDIQTETRSATENCCPVDGGYVFLRAFRKSGYTCSSSSSSFF